MIKESGQLLEEMNKRLGVISGLSEDDLQSIQEAIQVASDAIVQLKKIIIAADFHSTAEEIRFFKHIKPQFDGQLIFYLMLLRMHTCSMSAYPEESRVAYVRELNALRPFYQQHQSFWLYYRTGQTYMDEHYFIRQSNNIHPILEADHIHYDWQANTLMSVTTARLHAYELFREHASSTIIRLHPKPTGEQEKIEERDPITWTAPKILALEILYSAHEHGAFNNGQVSFKRITDHFSLVYGVKFGNVYKSTEDMRLRKKNPTPGLDALKSAFIRRADRENENAM